MNTSHYRDFGEFIGSILLEEVIEWIGKNLNVSDVFSDDEIHGHISGLEIEDIFSESTICVAASHMPIEDVFTDEQLKEWAIDNGFVHKEDEC